MRVLPAPPDRKMKYLTPFHISNVAFNHHYRFGNDIMTGFRCSFRVAETARIRGARSLGKRRSVLNFKSNLIIGAQTVRHTAVCWKVTDIMMSDAGSRSFDVNPIRQPSFFSISHRGFKFPKKLETAKR
ncbi:hypothetical protein NPIL_42761 [Nephila pilipes]|uniref:Uncharacterized protein n=1 Tax=Nephila pilipes TaxID=299642 RepID=A0A8X6NE37_NEPPI|nr:hypothetical protein NPIL_42761 [Nephila pilipes]